MKLLEFVSNYNNNRLELNELGNVNTTLKEMSEWLGDDIPNIIRPHQPKLRASYLHMPAICQALVKLGYIETVPPMVRQLVHLSLGNFYERLFVYLLNKCEVELDNYHKELEFSGVTGTIDFTIEGIVTDFKTMTGRLVSDFCRYPYSNTAYCYQLLFYKHVLGVDKAQWLVYDKWENYLYIVPFDNPGYEEEFLTKMTGLFEILKQVNSIHEAFEILPVPEPREGKIPFYLQKTIWEHLFYKKAANKIYVRPTQHIISNVLKGIKDNKGDDT